MDYNTIHGPGFSNFSSPLAHRMPTVSAAQALQDLSSSSTRCISTGLHFLDCCLQNKEQSFSTTESVFGGVSRGTVTEIYGPPGVGKTALCMQLAASVLHAGEGVVWVDASHPLSGSRLSQVLASYQSTPPTSTSPNPSSISTLLSNITHFSVPALVHLIALVCHPTPNSPPQNTSLIVIDSFSTLIANAFPRSVDSNATSRKPGAPKPSSRKFLILQHLISSLSKLAATRNLALVITSQCATKMRAGASAVLVPAVNSMAWEQGLGCRVEMMRDWGWDDEDRKAVDGVRLVRVVKAEGLAVARPRLVGLGIGDNGIHLLTLPTQPLPNQATHPQHSSQLKNTLQCLPHNPHASHTAQSPTTPGLPQKRKLSATDLEIPDSDAEDDEDYGWAEEDEEDLPLPPPQWQGSEDALAPPAEEEQGDEELLELGVGTGQGQTEEEGAAEGARKKVWIGEVDDSEDELVL
ncbi:hypothetical protein PZA11_002013 [Diplocarpon coronariae]